ncbi:MAG TPA: phage holin family protein [Nocardioidaceae bacterium]
MTVSGSNQVPTDSVPPPGTGSLDADRSLGELLGDIANNLTTLVKDELELAKTEAKNEAAKAGKGVGLLGGAGVTGHLALLFLSLTVVYLLDTWMHQALAALIVTVLWAIVAAVLATRGRKELKEFNPKLETTQRTVKEDVQWAKAQKNS